MNIMKTLFASLMLIFSANFVLAQNQFDTSHSALTHKPWSMQFAVGNNFVVTSFKNYTVSLERKLSDRFSVRTGIGGSFSHRAGWQISAGYGNNDVTEDIEIQFESVCIYNFDLVSRLSAYVGLGPVIDFSYEYEDLFWNNGADILRSTGWSGGLSLVVGGEWYVMPDVSVFGEYQLMLTYNRNIYKGTFQNLTSGNSRESDSRSTVLVLKANFATFGFSVHF